MKRVTWFARTVLRWAERRLGVQFVMMPVRRSPNSVKTFGEAGGSFALDSEGNPAGWTEVFLDGSRRRVLRVMPSDSIVSHSVGVGRNTTLSLEFCLMNHAELKPAFLLVVFSTEGDVKYELFQVDVATLSGMSRSVRYTVDLGFVEGKKGQFSISARIPDESRGSYFELGILEFSVADADLLSLLRARTHKSWREGNELRHFESGVYDHAIYANRKLAYVPKGQGHPRLEIAPVNTGSGTQSLPLCPVDRVSQVLTHADWAWPKPHDDAYHFAHRLLEGLLPTRPPDYVARLKSRSNAEPVQILSICSGTANVEMSIIAKAGVNVEATFLDINRSLIEQAVKHLPRNCVGHCIVANVNDVWPLPGRFDIVVCVSGLHHVVELEHTLAGIRSCLKDDGEFWVIGEQVGRNGNRLWPEAREACNRAMSELPPRYRVNAHSLEVDDLIPDGDFSSACFEGVRSEEIDGLLARHFFTISEYRRNSFLWRLVNQAYADNYDLTKTEDVQVLRQLVVAEVAHWWEGGRPTELFGVFAPRRLLLSGGGHLIERATVT